jgi:hypothetical protein
MVKDIILSAGIYVEAFCLVGSTLDDCAMVQDIHKNNSSIGKGLVTKKSMVQHLPAVSNLPIFVVPDDVWKGVWVNTDKVWNKNITFFKPNGGGDPSDSCQVANFEFVTNYSLGKPNE